MAFQRTSVNPRATERPITAVVASTPEGVIGHEHDMPWRLSTDLRRFKKLTMGGTLVMGRTTFESIGRALPGRQTIVLTRQPDWSFPGVNTATGNEDAIEKATGREIFVVGGGQIYSQWWDRCDEIWWTRVWANLTGDTRIELPHDQFETFGMMSCVAGSADDYPTDWLSMRRKKS